MDDSDIDVRAIFGVLRRQFALIVKTMLVVLGGAALVILLLTPNYTATTLIMVDPSPKNLLDPAALPGSTGSDSARVESEVELVRSDAVLMQVIADMQLVNDSEFDGQTGWAARIRSWLHLANNAPRSKEEALGDVLNRLRASVTVQRRGLTYLIAVQARSERPARAAELANAVAGAYIRDQVSSKIASTLGSRDILQGRIDQARQSITASESAFDSFIAANLDQIVSQTGDTTIAGLRAQIDELATSRNQTATTADALRHSLDSGDWAPLSGTATSPTLRDLIGRRDDLAGRLAASAAGTLGLADMRAELVAVDAQLRDAAAAELPSWQAAIIEGQSRDHQLREALRTAVFSSALPADLLVQIYDLQQKGELARGQYQTLLARAQDLSAQAELQIADSRVVSPALVPVDASFPNPPLFLMLGAVAALGFGVGLAFLKENVVGGFSSEDQAEAVLRLPIIASLPRLKAAKAAEASFAETLVTAPISAFSEAVRRVRAALDRAGNTSALTREGTVVMVSSTAPGEGKTTTALSLARSYALSGKSTLLIDCDLRKPSVHHQLGIEQSVGLFDYLDAQTGDAIDIQTVTAKDPLSAATVIAGARRSTIPTDQLVAGAGFAQLIAAARRSFDVVLLDTPPLAALVDGLYIAPHADAVVFVIRYSSTRQSDVRKALASLEGAKPDGAAILLVLNQQEVSQRSYRRRYGADYAQA